MSKNKKDKKKTALQPAGKQAESDSDSNSVFHYQPECNTQNLRNFLKEHAFLLGALTIFSPIFAIMIFGIFSLFFGLFTLSDHSKNYGAFYGMLTVGPLLTYILSPLCILLGVRLAKIVFQPTHLFIKDDGIYLQWRQRLGQPLRLLVSWAELKYIDLKQVKNKIQRAIYCIQNKRRQRKENQNLRHSRIKRQSSNS